MPESSRLARACERRRGADTRVCSAETLLGATGREDQETIPAGNVSGGTNQDVVPERLARPKSGETRRRAGSGDGGFARMTTLEGLNCAGGKPVLDRLRFES